MPFLRPLPLIAGCTLLALAACSKVTPDNYAKVTAGMNRDDVHALLGKPDDVSGGSFGSLSLSTETWTSRKHVVTVTFAGDRVTIKTIEPVGK